MPRQQLSAIGNGNGDGDGQWRWWLRLPMVTETAMADGKGNSNGNGWWQQEQDGGSDGQWWLQQQWPTAMAVATAAMAVATALVIGYNNVDSNGNADGNSNGEGNGDCNGDVHGNGNDDKGRVASSVAGNVQRYGSGNILPPPPWTQRKVHSPVLHMGVTLLRVFAPFQGGGFLTAHHWLFFVYFYNYC